MGILRATEMQQQLTAEYARRHSQAEMPPEPINPHLIDPLTLEYRALAAQGAFQNPYAFASWLQSRVPQKRPSSGVGSGLTGGV